MLRIENLRKSFGNLNVLNGLNLHLKQGEICAIVGPSGSGKSTFLRCINALEVAQSGRISIDSVALDYARHTKKEILSLRRKTAMVFQNYNLFINKNALENVMEALLVVRKMSKPQAEEIALARLRQVGLEDRASFYPHQLSGGQQQRIGIARALALNPSVILLDEPTSALDPELVEEVLTVILGIKDTTMLVVTHKLHFAKVLANRIVFMADGSIIEEGDPTSFFENTKHPRTKAFLEKMTLRDSYN